MDGGRSAYHGREAALATCHGKEAAIAPSFLRLAGISVDVAPDIDTDRLGTFTGDVPRPGSMLETARLKARMGMAATGLPLGLASEGSFGPHPDLPFLAGAREILLFRDEETGTEIVESQLSEVTNFAALELVPGADLEAFLSRAGFPSHGLVVRMGEQVVRGVTDRAVLDRLVAEGAIRLETDMRAHMNPTRMDEIARLAERLARRIANACPACSTPGYGPLRSEPGLPCSDCGAATRLVYRVIDGCARCGHERSNPRPDRRTEASPAECDLCNP